MDLNMMMREQAQAGLNAELDAAVTAGDTAKAREITGKLAAMAVQLAPKAPPFGPDEIKAEMSKLDWFGVDPKKSGRAIQLGKDMDPKKFASAEAFAVALVKAVEEEFKPAAAEPGENEEDEELEDDENVEKKPTAKPRKTDGPGEGDAGSRATRRTSGPWVKLADAPAETQKEINRTADKFAPKTKEGREGYVKKALEAHYAIHQRKPKK